MIDDPDAWARLKKAIASEYEKQRNALAEGSARSYEAYKGAVGYLQALVWVRGQMDEIRMEEDFER